jgi:type IV pilus assembly protein PilV
VVDDRPVNDRANRRRSRQRGFSLIEVLVAVVVLSIGLLGLAALQASTTRSNHSALLRTQATNLAYDIVDRMRANVTPAESGDYDADYGALPDEDDPTPAANACDPALAPSGSIANRDLQEWKNTLACALPSGDGRITRDATNNRLVTVDVRWDDSRSEDSLLTFSVTTEL